MREDDASVKKKIQENIQTLSILLLLVIMAGTVGLFIARYQSMERAACVARLQERTRETGRQIEATIGYTQNYLNKISDVVYDKHVESEQAGREALAELGNMDMISRLELVMADGSCYSSSGQFSDPALSFDELAAQGSGITSRSPDPQSSNRLILRLFTPVRRGRRTVAILCGVVRLDRLPYLFPVTAYDSKAMLFLMESGTGNFLIDARGGTLSNLQDSVSYSFARGYTKEQYTDDILNRREGISVAKSPTTPARYYLSYTGTGVEDWMVMLAVPESVVLAQPGNPLFGLMAVLLVALAAVFFFWFLRDLRQRQARTDLRLRGARYMLNVQQILFRAHTQSKLFHEALDEVASYLAADSTLYCALEDDQHLILRSLGGAAADKAPPKRSNIFQLFPQTAKTVLEEGRFFSNRPFLWGEQDWQSARRLGVRNIMLVRLDKMDGKTPLGVLGVINADALWDDTTPLDQVALSFSMALENASNYQKLAYMSQVDELTGVMNRNSYETRLEELLKKTDGSLGCVYMDANGLHEINNHLGHDAGDEMLRSVADALLSSFDKETVFRIGGDEFVVLVQDMPREEMERRAKKVAASVEKVKYSVSVGIDWQEGTPKISQVVAAAEADMRKNKADYYANHGGERQMRNLNTRLEQTLSAKRDADALLSCLAPNFLGIYFVNPQTDTCRCLASADFFKQALEESKGSFVSAMDIFIQTRVHPDDQQRLLEFCHYDTLLTKLKTEGDQEIVYRRTDGVTVRVQVRQPRRAGDDEHEIMWIFSPLES